MDTRQPATKDKRKRESKNVNPAQTHSMETRSKAQNALNKRRKQETDPLKMGHVLEKIFSFLDPNSIKAARQVNPLWSVEGAKSLITKFYVKIPSEVRIGGSSTWTSKNIAIEKFKNFLSHKSKDFPVIPNIIVEADHDVQRWESLEVLGLQVKSLKLKFMDDEAKLLHNLLDLLPNLKYLKFEGMDRFKTSRAIIEVLISAMSKREKVGSSLTISNIVIALTSNEGLEVMEMLSNCKNIMIEDLVVRIVSKRLTHVPNFEAQIANILSRILSTSQNVLKRLIMKNCEYYLRHLEFPCMTALTYILLDFWPDSAAQLPSCKFPPSFRFSEKVPNLQEFNIDHSKQFKDFFQNLLENTGPAHSVERVNGNTWNIDNGIGARLRTFPNTEELRLYVRENSELEANFRSLWENGKNLKKLHFAIDGDSLMDYFPDLDFLFTGFDAETVYKIRETPNLDPFTLEELEKLRVNPSISNLKELEQLSVYFGCGRATNVPKRMFTVTAKYEINQLPKNPQILIDFMHGSTEDNMRAFEEVSKLSNFTVKF